MRVQLDSACVENVLEPKANREVVAEFVRRILMMSLKIY